MVKALYEVTKTDGILGTLRSMRDERTISVGVNVPEDIQVSEPR